MIWYRRIAAFSALTLLLVLCNVFPSVASDDPGDIKVKGFAAVPGTSLTLPLASGAPPVIIDVTFGIPAVTIPVQVTPSTKIAGKHGPGGTIVVADGDAVEIKASVVGTVLRASRLKLQSFPELELVGAVEGLPAAGITLPLVAPATQNMVVSLGASAVDVPVQLTSKTKLDDPPLTLQNGDIVRVEAVVRGGVIVVTKLKTGADEDDDEDDD
jgi:hypothetical protein